MKNSNFANMTWHLHYDVMSINVADCVEKMTCNLKSEKKNQSKFIKCVIRPSNSFVNLT